MSSLLMFNTVYGLEIQSVMLVFSTLLLTVGPPLYLLSDLPHPSPPSQSKRLVYTDSVWLGGGGGGVLSSVVDHILQ
jgi:hypothetical protein